MPNKFTNHIISINDELYNYLNDVGLCQVKVGNFIS